jgi:hypothetical protein
MHCYTRIGMELIGLRQDGLGLDGRHGIKTTGHIYILALGHNLIRIVHYRPTAHAFPLPPFLFYTLFNLADRKSPPCRCWSQMAHDGPDIP